MHKLLMETFDLMRLSHFLYLQTRLKYKLDIDHDLGYRVRDQILKIKRLNERKKAEMVRIDKLFSSAKGLDRIRGSYLKLSLTQQEREKPGLDRAMEKFNASVVAFLDGLEITGPDPTVVEEMTALALTDLIESKMAGIITKKFKAVIQNELKKIQSTVEEEVLEIIRSEAFSKKIKEVSKVSLEECIAKRPDSFKPSSDPKLEKDNTEKKDKKVKIV